MRVRRLVLWMSIASGLASAADCIACHKTVSQSQPGTLMGRALLLPVDNSVLNAHPKLSYQLGRFSYTIERNTYSVSEGNSRISVPIRWSFGARAQTYVFDYNGKFYESLVSFYPKTNALGITIGDERIQPKTLLEAFGRELHEAETKSCFGCHSERAVANDRLKLDALRPGVHCENCHSDTAAHQKNVAVIPKKLGRLSPEEVSELCGQCHRTWDRVVRDRLRGEINVRFQPYRLANSKCYDGSDKRMSCITCHDPHRDAAEGAAYYDGKCQACHSRESERKTCPVASSGCTSCHMPKVPLPGGLQVFTDHQIRVARAGDPYPN